MSDITVAAVSIRNPVKAAAWTWRALLAVGCCCAIVLAASHAAPPAYLQADPGLARLLRCMAVVKAIIVVPVLVASAWRLGGTVNPPLATAYLLCGWTLAGTTMLVWELTSIAWAAIAFHLALLGFLLTAWRDGATFRRIFHAQ